MAKKVKENVQQSFDFDKLDKKNNKSDFIILGIVVVIVGLIITALCLSSGKENKDLLSGKHHAEIVVKDYGTIKLELDADTAPITVANFINLANSGFYDNLTFHRIMEGFMIQGGDPNHNGTGGSSQKIKGEFKANGVTNNISHVRGVIRMARASGDMDSASSQFFIVHQDAMDSLDGQYAAFGHVTEGMDVVDKIAKDAKPTDNNGTIPFEQQPVIETIRVID